jgi:membrane protein required for colicin V production
MNWVDITILGIITLSALISVLRGFVKEALSLAAWVLAFWVAFTFSKHLAQVYAGYISTPSVQMVAAFVTLFVITLILAAIVNYLVGKLVEKSGLTGTDRMLGVVFGVVRGAVIIAILVLLAGLTPVPKDPWWKQSTFIPHFQEFAVWMRGFLPPDIQKNFVYD